MARPEMGIREATRILNSTPLGEVASEYRVRNLLNAFGMRSPRLLELGGRLLRERASWKRRTSRDAKHRERERNRQAELSASGRNIGVIPHVKNPARRKACRRDLAKFILTYAPEGKDPFSQDHLRVIRRIENAIFHGGRFVEAVYRGFGKTTISELTAAWAVLYGHKKYVPLIGANESRATENLNSIKGFFESEALLEDFPEVCHAIQCLEGINQRCHGQLHEGKPTHIEWSADTIVLPMTPGRAIPK